MKKYVPVKLKVIVLFFKNRATHVFWEQSQNKAKRSEETFAIEIKFKKCKGTTSIRILSHSHCSQLLILKRDGWNDVGWKWERTYHEKWTESQISLITNVRNLFETGLVCYPTPYILFLSIKTIKLITSSNPAGAARF